MFAHAEPKQKQVAKSTVQKKETKNKSAPNLAGIPDNMKSNFENYSGFSFNDVKVHYNSDKPAQLQALAHTQDNPVYAAPERKKHWGNKVLQNNESINHTSHISDVTLNNIFAPKRQSGVMATQILQRKVAPIRISANMPVVQRLPIPDSLKKHNDDLNSLGDKIIAIPSANPATDTLENYAPGSNKWAEETRYTAMRKYNEMNTALEKMSFTAGTIPGMVPGIVPVTGYGLGTVMIPGMVPGRVSSIVPIADSVKLGTNTTTESDVYTDTTAIEVKTVSGDYSQIYVNINAAALQLTRRIRATEYNYLTSQMKNKNGIVRIYITDRTFKLWMEKIASEKSFDLQTQEHQIGEIAKEFLTNHKNYLSVQKTFGYPTYNTFTLEVLRENGNMFFTMS